MQRERDESVVIDVGQLTLGLRPDELIGIEFRRVAREAVCLQPGMATEKDLDIATPMNLPAVPQQSDFTAEMTEQLAEKRDDLGARDVTHVEIEVQPEPTALRSHGERGDDGHSVMSIAVPKLGSVSDGRPGLAHVRDEQEAVLIEEREVSASARGVFLTGAIPLASTVQWRLHRAGVRAAPASANSRRRPDRRT